MLEALGFPMPEGVAPLGQSIVAWSRLMHAPSEFQSAGMLELSLPFPGAMADL